LVSFTSDLSQFASNSRGTWFTSDQQQMLKVEIEQHEG
jgi:hypothetical protein